MVYRVPKRATHCHSGQARVSERESESREDWIPASRERRRRPFRRSSRSEKSPGRKSGKIYWLLCFWVRQPTLRRPCPRVEQKLKIGKSASWANRKRLVRNRRPNRLLAVDGARCPPHLAQRGRIKPQGPSHRRRGDSRHLIDHRPLQTGWLGPNNKP